MEKSSVKACMSVFGFQWKHVVCIIEPWDINGLQLVKRKVSMKSVFVHVCVTGLCWGRLLSHYQAGLLYLITAREEKQQRETGHEHESWRERE